MERVGRGLAFLLVFLSLGPQWGQVSPQNALSFDRWKKTKEKMFPKSLPKEVFGRVIGCVGSCRLFRQGLSHSLSYRSVIWEQDRIQTNDEGHLWATLIDGALVRLGPRTNVTFSEINLEKGEELFSYLSLHWGNILWFRRQEGPWEKKGARETDRIFLPLKEEGLKRAPAPKENTPYLVSKKHTVMVSLQNGLLLGQDVSFEVLSLLGKRSFFLASSGAIRAYKGDSGPKGETLAPGDWWALTFEGDRLISNPETEVPLYFNQHITSYIPSIWKTREIFLKRYFRNIRSRYSLWEKKDWYKRVAVLLKYERQKWKDRKTFIGEFLKKREVEQLQGEFFQEHSLLYYKKSMDAMIVK